MVEIAKFHNNQITLIFADLHLTVVEECLVVHYMGINLLCNVISFSMKIFSCFFKFQVKNLEKKSLIVFNMQVSLT